MRWIDGLLDWIRGARYLVFETGYEGIEHVYGVFGRKRAIEFALEKKRLADLRKKADDAYEAVSAMSSERAHADGRSGDAAYAAYDSDPERLAADKERDRSLDVTGFGPSDPDFVCVVTVSERGTNCVCSKLGIKPARLMLR